MGGHIQTDFLTADSSVITGMGSAYNLGGNFYGFNYSKTPAEADQKALLSDWIIVGQDIDNAMYVAESRPRCLTAK
jgi:hypothetical protein